MVRPAFNTWEANSRFDFTKTTGSTPDIDIRFFTPGSPPSGFDDFGDELAYGKLAINDSYSWSVSSDPTGSVWDVETVALHEIGHIMGAAHSTIREALMWRTGTAATLHRGLHEDDIDAVAQRSNWLSRFKTGNDVGGLAGNVWMVSAESS